MNSVWACAQPEFRLSWINLCSSDNHHTTAPQLKKSIVIFLGFLKIMKLLVILFIIIMKLIAILNITYIISCEWHVNICKHDMSCALEMNSIDRQVWEILLFNHLRHYIFTTTTPMATKIWQSGDLPWGTHTHNVMTLWSRGLTRSL